VVPADTADAIGSEVVGLVGMRHDVSGNGIETRAAVGSAGKGDDGLFRRQIMPHEFTIEPEALTSIQAATYNEVPASVDDVADVALGEARASADGEVVPWGVLSYTTHAPEKQNQKYAYQSFLHCQDLLYEYAL
jgi:hypothetical protein